MRATHLFLPDREIKNIKAYVPQAKGFYEHMGFHNLQDGSGSVAEKIREYDQKILEVCGWKEGMLLLYSEFKQTIRSSACSQKGLYIIHAQSLGEIGLFLAFQHNYFTGVEIQHSFRTIGVVLIGQKHFFYRIFKFDGNGFTTEVGGDENAL